MDFDQLLRRYLDGGLSDAELERFQSLLERVPEFRAELRQTLELRSLLHDDALQLTPPAELSEHIRLAVGSCFAADSVLDTATVEERRRRVPVLPLRLITGAFVTACLAVGVALTPTLPGSSDQPSLARADRSVGLSARAMIADDAPSATSTVRAGRATPPSAQPARRHSTTPTSSAIGGVGEERLAATLPPTEDATVIATEASDPSSPTTTATDQLPPLRNLEQDVRELLAADDGSAFVVAREPRSEPADELPVLFPAATGGREHPAGEKWRRLAFGVLVGSGQVVESKSPTALLQNSYYFSFGVNSHDRIGVEMGASAFERERTVVQSSASSTPSGGFAKPTVGAPKEPTPEVNGTGASNGGQPVALVADSYEQQITYGAVFYDRRLRVNESWDLCGRVTVGGADNAVLGNVRAYAAYTPTENRNITLTLGVGGAGLYNLTSRGHNASGNYGIYYGIETGF